MSTTKPRYEYEATNVEIDFLSPRLAALHIQTTQPDADITIQMGAALVDKLATQISSRTKRGSD